MMSAKLEDFLSQFQAPANPPDLPPMDDGQDYDDLDDGGKETPFVPEPMNHILNILSDPDSELWNGVVMDSFVHFVDDVSFGWKVNLESDKFFITGFVYNISSLSAVPRSDRMRLVLGRIEFQGPKTPLFMLNGPGNGIVTIKESSVSETIVKILAPWCFQVLEGARGRTWSGGSLRR